MIYLDTCIVIYLIEPTSQFHVPVKSIMDETVDATFAVSHLTKAEAKVLPLVSGDTEVLSRLENVFATLTDLALPREVFELAASIRAQTRLKMPDALHVACARYHGCTELWTHDSRLAAAAPDLVRPILAQL